MTSTEVLFACLNWIIKKDSLEIDEYNSKEVFMLAKKHDLAHLLSHALENNNKLPADEKIAKIYSNEKTMAKYRFIKSEDTAQMIFDTLNEAQIIFVPLKGLRVRKYYPESWMRTSCDLDILVNEKDLDKALDALIEKGFESDRVLNTHDVSLYYGDVHLELHYNIIESSYEMDQVLSDVFNHLEIVDNYQYQENPDFFMFHHIAHMAYHFISGGCGIKPFMDLYVLKNKFSYDEEKLNDLLKKGNLLTFYNFAMKLVDVWFNGKEHNEITSKMEEYVLKGGVYGTLNNSLASGTGKKGKIGYIFSLAFPKYYNMCNMYPKLRRHKILLPFYYIIHIFNRLFGKNRKSAKEKMKAISKQNKNEIQSVGELLNALEISK